MVVSLPKPAPYTVDDLDAFPENDGTRYELIEGNLHVSASPSHLHQRALANLYRLMHAASPAHLEVLFAPVDVVFSPVTVLVPDLLVVPAVAEPDRRVEEPPLLVVEVLSPSTRHYDVGTKRPVYRDAGVGAYWVVDPFDPSLTAWRWGPAGDETEVGAHGDDEAVLDWPFPVTVVPARLPEVGG